MLVLGAVILPFLSRPFWQAISVRNFRTFTIYAQSTGQSFSQLKLAQEKVLLG